jgi:ABC-type spermidine/putrescine transport system permease subunit I
MCWVFDLDKLICSFVLILTRTRSVRNALLAFGTKDMSLSIVTEFTAVIIGAGTVVWIYDLLWSALFVTEIMCWIFGLDKLICSFMLILTRTRSIRNALLAFGTEDMGLSIIAKLTAIIVGARTVIRIYDLLWSALFVTEIMCWVFGLDKLICSFVLILTRTRSVRYALFAFGTKDMSLSIVTEFTAVIIGAGTVVYIYDLL